MAGNKFLQIPNIQSDKTIVQNVTTISDRETLLQTPAVQISGQECQVIILGDSNRFMNAPGTSDIIYAESNPVQECSLDYGVYGNGSIERDPIFKASPAGLITMADIVRWNAAIVPGVVGPSSSIIDNIVLFNNITGNSIKDSGQKLADFSVITHNHDGIYQPIGTYSTDIHSNITALDAVSGVNTGDNSPNSLYSGLITNVTHTGEVTGATALTVDKTTITNKSIVTITGSDYILLSDTSDNGDLKKGLVSDIVTNISGKEDTSNKVITISNVSTDTQYPSAKLLYDQLALKQVSGTYSTDIHSNITALNLVLGTNTGDNSTNTTSNAYADGKVVNAINSGVTTTAPSQGAVYSALTSKENTGVAATLDTAVLSSAKSYADGLVIGLWDDRGSFNASINTYPTIGGSGTAGAILKGDVWSVSVIATSGPLLGYVVGTVVRALVDSPAQTTGNWSIIGTGMGYVAENVSNKVTSISSGSTDVQYPSAKLLYDQLALKQIAGTYSTDIHSNITALNAVSGTNTGDNAVNTLYSSLITFPGFGTSHSTVAYGDHTHSGVYQPVGTYSTDIHSNITALNAVTGTNTGNQTLTIAGTTSPTVALSGSNTVTFTGAGSVTLGQTGGTITITGGVSMTWPSAAGIAIYNGSNAWGTSITDNSSNWNTAYTNRITSLTVTGSSGAATLVTNTLNIPTYTLAGLGGIGLTSLSATSPIFYSNTTGVISSQAATTLVSGYLTSTDWNSFNNKVTNATHTGDATGSTSLTVVALNGTNLAGLGTGLLKNTTGTGIPSIITDNSSNWNTAYGWGNHASAGYASASGYIPYTGGTTNVNLGVHNLTVDTTTLFIDSVNHRVGIGTTSPTGMLTIQGTTSTDYPTLSTEFLLDTGWTSIGWTGSFATGWAHTPGNVTALSQSGVAISATKYLISYTVTGMTLGTFIISFGGKTNLATNVTGAWGPTTSSTAGLVITPTTDFDGTIVVSIKSITAGSSALTSYKTSDGIVKRETRISNTLYTQFDGVNSGMYNLSGISNVGFGYYTLSKVTTGYSNTAVGREVCRDVDTGFYNTGMGNYALAYITTGDRNVGIGAGCVYSLTTGSSNIGIGYNTVRNGVTCSYNIGIGTTALINATGNSNVAVGYNALGTLTTGGNNIALGYQAGTYITNGSTSNLTASNSTFIGFQTKSNADAETNQTVIGYNAIGIGSNSISLGNSSVTKLAIGANEVFYAPLKLGSAGTASYVLTSTGPSTAPTWQAAGTGSMTWPVAAGIVVYSGSSSWGSSITDNSTNWNAAFGWGNHASAGYIPYTEGTSNVNLGAHNLTIDTNTLFVDATNHRVGIGTTTPTAQLSQKTIAAMESGNINAYEEIPTGGITSTGWTGSFNSYTHTVGNTSPLTFPFSPGIFRYLIRWTVTGRTAGNFEVTLGGVTYGSSAGSYNATDSLGIKTDSVGDLLFTPSSDFDGTISNASIMWMDDVAPVAVYDVKDSSDNVVLELRNGTATTNNLFFGKNSGAYNIGNGNLAFGSNALYNNITGNNNTAIGSGALLNNDAGENNLAIGANAMQYNTTGYNNTALGSLALNSNVRGAYNVAIGGSTMWGNISGSNNVAMGGFGALSSNTTGSNNVALGNYALGTNTTATRNIAIGIQSLRFATGDANIGIGHIAGTYIANGTTENTASSGCIYIGASTRASSDSQGNEIVIGIDAIGFGTNSISLGSSSINKLAIGASEIFYVPLKSGSAGTAGNVLTSTGISTAPTWQASTGNGVSKGTIILNYDGIPGTNIITVTVSDINVLSTSVIIAQMPARATATHNVLEHQTVPIKLSVGNIINGVSFDLTGTCDWRLNGTFNVDYIII